MLNYKGYFGRVEFDDEAKLLHGEVVGTRDVITFEADSASKVGRAFRDSVDDYLAYCAERNESPEKPASGNFMVRLPRDLHRDIDRIAKAEGKSLNAVMQEAAQKKRDSFWAAVAEDEADLRMIEASKKRNAGKPTIPNEQIMREFGLKTGGKKRGG